MERAIALRAEVKSFIRDKFAKGERRVDILGRILASWQHRNTMPLHDYVKEFDDKKPEPKVPDDPEHQANLDELKSKVEELDAAMLEYFQTHPQQEQ